MFQVSKKLRAISSPCDTVFLWYYKNQAVYKISFANDPTGYRNEHYGTWALAKAAFLKHIETKKEIARKNLKVCA